MMWHRTRAIAPNEEDAARGTKLFCQIDRGRAGGGTVRNEQGIIQWRYAFRKNANGCSLKNPFNKRDFVMAEPDGSNEVIVSRASFFPPVFNIQQGERTFGNIKLCSPLRNKYSIEIDGRGSWMFRMPLFTISFYGVSSTGADIWVVVGPSEMEWSILLKSGIKEWPLAAALAFIHNERWHYS